MRNVVPASVLHLAAPVGRHPRVARASRARRHVTVCRGGAEALAPLYVYAGAGASREGVGQVVAALGEALPMRATYVLGTTALRHGAWADKGAMLVMPGGRDAPYARDLAGEPNARIRAFVAAGGTYLGLCAGGYYGARHVAFAVGDCDLEVVGDRELGFYPGTCRGPILPGFSYAHDRGARVVRLQPSGAQVYYHGGGAFELAHDAAGDAPPVQVVATYDLQPERAAVVACRVGRGRAVLTGVHPEIGAAQLSRRDHPVAMIDALAQGDLARQRFWVSLLRVAGLVEAGLGQDVSVRVRRQAPAPAMEKRAPDGASVRP